MRAHEKLFSFSVFYFSVVTALIASPSLVGKTTVTTAQNKVGRAASVDDKSSQRECVKYWEIIADNLSKAGWSLGWVSAADSEGRTIWIVDAHRDNGKRFVVRSDEMLTAFLELERITHQLALSALLGDDSN